MLIIIESSTTYVEKCLKGNFKVDRLFKGK